MNQQNFSQNTLSKQCVINRVCVWVIRKRDFEEIIKAVGVYNPE